MIQTVESAALADLPVGAWARIRGLSHPAEHRELLEAMGLTDGSFLRVCRQGEPCIVQVHATRVGLARSLARSIRVEPASLDPIGAGSPLLRG